MDGALVACLLCVALAMHVVPLLFSPLPLNPDGFPLARVAQQITATGTSRLTPTDVNNYTEQMPVYSLLWSMLAQVGGLGVLADLQAMMPLLTATVVLPAYLLGVKATRSRVVGFASGLFVAMFGSFLFLTSAAMKESLGLLLLPTVVLLFQERADPRKRALAAALLLLLPFLHHLTTLMAFGMVCALIVLQHSRSVTRGTFSARRLALDIVTGPALGVVPWVYYSQVGMPYFRALVTVGAVALFVSLAVLLAALLVPRRRPSRPRPGKRLVVPASRVLLVPAIALAALWVNGQTSLFVGVAGTQAALVTVLPAVAVLVAFAFLGFQLVLRTTNRASDLVLSMLTAPVCLVLFGFLRGLDPLGQVIVYRAFDFLDYALALLVGVGFAIAWGRLRISRAAQLALGAGLFAVLLATTPMAWNSQAVFGVNEVTTPAEFQTLAVLASLHPRNVATDQRLAYIAQSWFEYPASPALPWLLENHEAVSGYDYAVVLASWMTIGAQVYPAPNIVLSPAVISAFLQANRVVYTAGSGADQVYVVQLT